jgi:hypothetical protein
MYPSHSFIKAAQNVQNFRRLNRRISVRLLFKYLEPPQVIRLGVNYLFIQVRIINLSSHASREITQFEHLISTWRIFFESHGNARRPLDRGAPNKFPSENYALRPLINFVVYSLLTFAPPINTRCPAIDNLDI